MGAARRRGLSLVALCQIGFREPCFWRLGRVVMPTASSRRVMPRRARMPARVSTVRLSSVVFFLSARTISKGGNFISAPARG